MKITKEFAKKHGIIFYPAYAYRRYPNSNDILEKYATYSGKKAIKKAKQMFFDDDATSVFTKIGKQWYEVLKEVSDGDDFIVRKENNEKKFLLSEVIKKHMFTIDLKQFTEESKQEDDREI